MNKRGAEEYGELFLECLKSFSTQNPKEFLSDPETFFRADNEDWRINRDHKFWSEHRNATWTMRVIADSFLLQIQHIEGNPKPYEWQGIRKEIGLRLQDQVNALLRGIDFDLITAISGEKYESRDGKNLSITIFPYPMGEQDLLSYGVQLFREPFWLRFSMENVHALRKQLNLSETASLAVCYFEMSMQRREGLYMTGVLSDKVQNCFPRIYYTAHMEWELHLPVCPAEPEAAGSQPGAADKRCVLRYFQGRLMLPKLSTRSHDHQKVSDIFQREQPVAWSKIAKLIERSRGLKGGAVVVIAEESILKQECSRLCSKHKRGVELWEPVDILATPEFISRFARVDGALFVSPDCHCHAYGVILDGEAYTFGNPARGARYNSTKNYIEALRRRYPHHSALGVVVSEDGMIDLFPD